MSIHFDVYKAGGSLETLTCTKGDILNSLQKAVGGFIQVLEFMQIQGERVAIVGCEDAIPRGMPLNRHDHFNNYYGNIVVIPAKYL